MKIIKRKRYLSVFLALLLVVEIVLGNSVNVKAKESDKLTGMSEELQDGTMIQVEVVDEQGNKLSGVECELIDVSASNEVIATLVSETDGMIEYSVKELQDGAYRLKIPFRGEYLCKPNEGYLFEIENGKIAFIDSMFYFGDEELQFVLSPIEDTGEPEIPENPGNNESWEDKGKITLLKLDQQELSCEGGTLVLEVSGEKLKSNVNIDIYHTMSSERLKAVNTVDTDSLQMYTIEVPENTDTEDKEYMIACAIKGDILSTETISFRVAGKENEESGDITGNAVITSVEATPDHVSAQGGNVSIKVTGTDLTANNWGVDAKAYIADTDVSMADRFTVKVSEMTESGAVLTIPANTMRNDIEYRINVGALRTGGIENQCSVTVLQERKAESIQVNPKSVEVTDVSTIVATMEQNIKIGTVGVEALKEKVYIADYGNKNLNRIELTEKDSITISNNQITIVFDEMPDLHSASALYAEEGAFKTASGVNLKAFSWIIVSKPMITGVELKDDILESNGGIVEGVLKGVRLSEVNSIEAKIMKAGSVHSTDIPVHIGSGNEPSISFEVPQNDTELTQSYSIDLTMGNTPVYVESVVSVLPAGVSDTEQTLAALTISGNNKIYTNDNSTEIIVKVSPQVGELKTRLNLYGTNLDSKKTEVRAIDQYGVVWPVYHIPE